MSFAKLSQKKTPNQAIVDLMHKFNFSKKHKALDVGAGPLIETKFLLDKNFTVFAVDSDSESQKIAQSFNNESLVFVLGKIQEVDLLKDEFDLVLSFNTLSFIPKGEISLVFNKITDSVKVGGYIIVSFFGNRDDWAKKYSNLSFFTRSQVTSLFDKNFNIERFIEEDKKGMTVQRIMKNWHIFTVVAKKML